MVLYKFLLCVFLFLELNGVSAIKEMQRPIGKIPGDKCNNRGKNILFMCNPELIRDTT